MFHIKSIDYPHLFQNHDMGCIKQLTFKRPQVNAETYQGICGGGEKGGIYPPFYPPIFGKIGILSIPVYHAYTCKFGILCARVVKLLLKYREVLCAFGLLYRF